VRNKTPLVLGLFASLALATAPAAAQNAPPSTPSPPAAAGAAGAGGDEKAPVQLGNQDAQAPAPARVRAPKTVWVGWTFGSGFGYHGKGDLEANAGRTVDPAFAPGLLGYFGPEIGYQYDERLFVSLQGRHQVIPKKMPDPTATAKPKQWAHAALLRAAWLFPQPRFQAYAGGALGGGDGFRFRIDPQPSSQARLDTSDTVRGGPVVLGPLVGIVLPFEKLLSVVAEARLLSGLPDFGLMMDFSFGVQFDFTVL
jgi:hypothetical protein